MYTLIIGEFFGKVFEGIGGAILDGLRSLCFSIDKLIYELIINLYNLFIILCNGQIISSTMVQMVMKRVGYILGVIMLFIVLISVLQMILDPDKVNDKETGVSSIIRKILIVIVMFGLSSYVFNLTYDIQKIVLGVNSDKSNVIQKIILPFKFTYNSNDEFSSYLSSELFTSFYYVNKESYDETEFEETGCLSEPNVIKLNIVNNGGIKDLQKCVNLKYDSNKEYIMNFDELLSVIAGIFVVYILLIYCIKVGIRMVQIAFLQMISPMAFVSYLAPKKDTMFNRWKNMYISTYLDVFIRVAIISLVVAMIGLITSDSVMVKHADGTETNENVFWTTMSENNTQDIDLDDWKTKTFIKVVMIIALLEFGKRAPELLKELLPKGGAGSIGFGLGKKDNEGFFKTLGFGRKTAGLAAGVATGKAVGIIGGVANGKGIGGKIRGALAGGFTGGFRGAAAGLKSKSIIGSIGEARKRQAQANVRSAQRIANDVGWLKDLGENAARGLGIDTSYGKLDREISLLESENAAYNQFDAYFDAAQKRLDGQIEKGVYNDNVHAANALRQKNMAEIYRQQSANVKENDFLKYYDRTGQELEYHSTIENGEKFEWLTDTNGGVIDFDDAIQSVDRVAYQQKLNELADLASQADSAYINEMKAAKKDIITGMLNGSRKEVDPPTMQNLQQAAGVIDANATNGFDAFKGITGEDLLKGDFDMFDKLNGEAKGKIAENNNRIAEAKVRNQAGKIYNK